MKKTSSVYHCVSLSAAPLWSSLAASYKCSFLLLLLLSVHQLAHSSVLLLDFRKPGRGIYHISLRNPSPPFSLILSFIFLFFNNSLSALSPLIKMNSLCCRLLPSCLSLSRLLSLCTLLTLFLKSPPSPSLTFSLMSFISHPISLSTPSSSCPL